MEVCLTSAAKIISLVMTLLALTAPASATNERIAACFRLAANVEQRNCLRDLYHEASAELDRVYRDKIEGETKSDWAERIAASQKAWEAYREAECWNVIGQIDGSGRMTWVFGCAAEKTFERIDELKVPFYRR